MATIRYMASKPEPQQLTPMPIFETLNAYQHTAALRSALELGLFTTIGSGSASAEEIAKHASVAERGARILCDYLVCLGFLAKDDHHYTLTPVSSTFLDRKSPSYMGDCFEFLLEPKGTAAMERLTEAVRRGGTAPDLSALEPEEPAWIKFARTMAPLMVPLSRAAAEAIPYPTDKPIKVLDVAASHGLYGISVAQRYPKAKIVALDWENVLEVTTENAQKHGIADRHSTISGSIFEVDLGTGYDVVLLPNILHHFSVSECDRILGRCASALNNGGCVILVEFVPNEDRVSPAPAAMFSLRMLAQTPEGDAYTFDELQKMLSRAGFKDITQQPIPNSMHTLVTGRR